MPQPITVQIWSPVVRIPSTIAHVVAILTTLFRLLYRWHMSKFWWEDTWALLALICDIACLASLWMQVAPVNPYTQPPIDMTSNWLLSLSITSVLWFARMSILCSIVRIANPTQKLRWIAYSIGAMFIAMDAGLLAQKIFICMVNLCRFTNHVAVAQLVTDIISDISLVATPARFLQDVKLSRDRRILIMSAFSASLLITGITILHSILLFEASTNATITIGHIKAAFALFLCNALLLVTFVHRLCQKPGADQECYVAHGRGVTGGDGSAVEFTSVIDLPSKHSSCVDPAGSWIQSREDAAGAKQAGCRGAHDERCDDRVYEMGSAGGYERRLSW